MSTPNPFAGRYSVSIDEIVKAIGRSRPYVYKEINAGRLKTYRPDPGGKQFIRVSDFEAWFEGRSDAAA